MSTTSFVPGIRITARGEDFLVTKAEEDGGTYVLDVEGISELVKGKRFKFDTRLDSDIRVLDPVNTALQADNDHGYRKTKLFLETHLRNSSSYSDLLNIFFRDLDEPEKLWTWPNIMVLLGLVIIILYIAHNYG